MANEPTTRPSPARPHSTGSSAPTIRISTRGTNSPSGWRQTRPMPTPIIAWPDSEVTLRPMVEALSPACCFERRPRPVAAAGWRSRPASPCLRRSATDIGRTAADAGRNSTGPGEIRTSSLGGSGSAGPERRYQSTLTGFDRRHVRLDQGQIFLRLRRRRARPGRSSLRRPTLVDVGTVFEVSRDGQLDPRAGQRRRGDGRSGRRAAAD